MIILPFVPMRRYELIGGCVWLLGFLYFWGKLLGWIDVWFSLGWSLSELNMVYYVTNFLITGILFRRFLAESFLAVLKHPLRFIAVFEFCFIFYWLTHIGFQVLYKNFVNSSPAMPNDDAVERIEQQSRYIMVTGAVFLAPLTEESLIRGLLFGNLRRLNRPIAYVVTALVFTLMHIDTFLSGMTLGDILFDTIIYSLGSVFLSMDYELSGSIWGPVLLHMSINGFLILV